MSQPKPKTAEQELAEAQQLATRATKEYAAKKADADAVGELAPQFLEALKGFEDFARAQKLSPEKALVVASAVHASVQTRLLAKCGLQQDDSEAEMKRIDALHTDVHALSNLGVRLERRVVTKGVVTESSVIGGPVAGVGKMTLEDVSKGS